MVDVQSVDKLEMFHQDWHRIMSSDAQLRSCEVPTDPFYLQRLHSNAHFSLQSVLATALGHGPRQFKPANVALPAFEPLSSTHIKPDPCRDILSTAQALLQSTSPGEIKVRKNLEQSNAPRTQKRRGRMTEGCEWKVGHALREMLQGWEINELEWPKTSKCGIAPWINTAAGLAAFAAGPQLLVSQQEHAENVHTNCRRITASFGLLPAFAKPRAIEARLQLADAAVVPAQAFTICAGPVDHCGENSATFSMKLDGSYGA